MPRPSEQERKEQPPAPPPGPGEEQVRAARKFFGCNLFDDGSAMHSPECFSHAARTKVHGCIDFSRRESAARAEGLREAAGMLPCVRRKVEWPCACCRSANAAIERRAKEGS